MVCPVGMDLPDAVAIVVASPLSLAGMSVADGVVVVAHLAQGKIGPPLVGVDVDTGQCFLAQEGGAVEGVSPLDQLERSGAGRTAEDPDGGRPVVVDVPMAIDLVGATPRRRQVVEVPDPNGPGVRQGFLAIYSKTRNKLFLVGGYDPTTGAPKQDVWLLRSDSWWQVRTALKIRRPLAATYSLRDNRLWIIDEKQDKGLKTARLLRLDPETGAFDVLETWPRFGIFDQVWLTLDADGNVLLSSSSDKLKQHLVVRFEVGGEGPEVDKVVQGKGALSFAPVVDSGGYTFAIQEKPFQLPQLKHREKLGGSKGQWGHVGGCF